MIELSPEQQRQAEAVRDFVLQFNDEALLMDEYAAAFVGVASRCAGPTNVAVYCRDTIREILVQDGSTAEDAEEYIDFNIEGAYVGPSTPMLISRFTTGR